MKIIKNKNCRMCGGSNFKSVINMGKNPLVNSLIDSQQSEEKEPVFTLAVKQCQDCFLVQIKDIVDSNEIYKNVDYLYFSGDMPKLDEYFRPYADKISELAAGELVVEVGSNDGLMLKMIKDKGVPVLGVDPASNVVARALKNGIPTISDFFSERLAKSIKREFGPAKVIYGNNCIAHLNNLVDLMKGVKALLKDDGVFIVECNYWGNMVKNTNYALIYHDHFSYFTVETWVKFAEKFDMDVFDAEVTPAQGGSLRIFMANKSANIGHSAKFCDLLLEEQNSKLNSYETCQKYNKAVHAEANKLYKLVNDLKSQGKKIAGYGAAAKGFSVLTMAGIDQRHIDYFVDDSPAKQGKFTPVSRIPVVARQEADKLGLPDYFFITAPNYEKVIVDKEAQFALNGGKFITCDSRVIG